MLGTLPTLKKNLGAPLQSRKAMLETLFRHLDMVRLSVGAMLMITLVGCTGLIDGGSDGLTTQERKAQAKWKNNALPVLKAQCVTCHNGSRAMVEFLAGTEDLEIRDKLVNFTPAVVNFEAPASSRLLTKGVHDGPALNAEDTSSILQWLQAQQDSNERDPANPVAQLAIPAFAVQICTAGLPDDAGGLCPTNHVAMSTLGDAAAMIPGAEITFTAQALGAALYITNLKLAGGTAGAAFEHPLFVSVPAMGEKIPDQIDRYFALKMNVKPAVAEQISGGTAVFEGFDPTNKLEIHFKKVGAFQPDAGGGTIGAGGCKVVDSFKANAVGPLKASCASCHANPGQTNAKSAMDITGLDSADAAAVLTACNQVRTRINLTTTDQSGFYLAPDPASNTNHPFKFPAGQFTTTFKTPVDIWVQAEKKAP